MRWALLLALTSCHRAPAAAVSAAPPPAAPRCERAGGRCVGPAAIAANPSAPCPPGLHRVDDVALREAPLRPACLGIPLGEEACCLPDGAP